MFRSFTLGGIAGPVLFAVVVVICGALRPDYSHTTQFISELGETGGAWSGLMNYAGFMTAGALIVLSALGLAARFPNRMFSALGSVLVAVFGTGIFAAGVFSCDATCFPESPTPEQIRHNLVSFIAFIAMIGAAVMWGLHFMQSREWRGFARYSFLTAMMAFVLLVAMVAIAEQRVVTGLIQRIFLATLFLWLALLPARAWRTWAAEP